MENEELNKRYRKLTQEKLNEQLGIACVNGDLTKVKYLLTSKDLKRHADIKAVDSLGFCQACLNGHINIVKYMLFDEELINHVTIHAKGKLGFKLASLQNHHELINFFIFEMKIRKTKSIEIFLQKNPNEQVQNWFNLRELNDNLEKDLSSKKNKTKKIKL